MAASLIARSVSVTRGALTVLDSVDLTLAPGRRIGLVGPNGVGKSTLLRVLAAADRAASSVGVDLATGPAAGLAAGLDGPASQQIESGHVELLPATATVGLLPQEPSRSASETVRRFLARRTGVAVAQAELDATTQALADGESDAAGRYSDALERWLALGAADFDARVGETWAELGLHDRLLDQPTATLSGGEAARASLASLFLSRFDVVLLDEPTNDLDLDGLARLEDWVVGLDSPAMIVSHDRTFLERTITDVVEIDHHTHRATWFAGGWTAFLAERELAQQHARDAYSQYDSKRQSLLDRAQRQREWASQGQAKVRRSGENDKHITSFKVNQTEQLAGKAARTQKMIDRLESVEEPHEPWELRLEIPTIGRSGDLVAELRGAVVRRGSFELGPLDLTIAAGDRVALLGSNGSGKTTLIDLLLGRIEPTSGTVRRGASVRIGEVEQARMQLTDAATLLRSFMDAGAGAGTVETVADARTLLAKFGLASAHVTRSAASLSPGERTRASLALLMATGANVLVLDEPTNHLDIEAIEQLEQALESFEGTVVLVTHDRSLLDRVRTTRTIELRGGSLADR